MFYKDIVFLVNVLVYVVLVSRNIYYIELFVLWGNRVFNRFLCI